jgi:hypothetical protein
LNEHLVPEEELIERVALRLNAAMVGLVLGFLFAAGLFVATVWLVIKGGPHPGAHLILLSQFFPGYSISFLGAICGSVYGFIVGFVTGAVLGAVYNKLAR